MHVQRLIRRRDSSAVVDSGLHSLPSDLSAAIPRRLAAVAILYAIVNGVLYAVYQLFEAAGGLSTEGPWGTIALVMTAICLGFAALTRAKLGVERLLIMGLVFEVVGAIGIDIGFLFVPLENASLIGVSWTGVWIIAFPMLVPVTPGRAFLAAFTAASVLPVVLLVRAAGGESISLSDPIGLAVVANYVCAGIAVAGSKVIYGLTRDVSRARQMGSYVLGERLGEGGMGEVWRAEHRLLARPAAVKLVRLENGDAAERSDAQRRFEREARATAALTSPHSVALFDYGVAEDGAFYYVMELLDGVDFHDLVDRFGPQTPARVVHLLAQACAARAEAHEGGLVHRDIKPANLYLCRQGMRHDFVKVLDFGLVKSRAGDQTVITQRGVAAGTPAYMAPEIALGEEDVDGRADIYALGCVAYWLLTGRPVFERDGGMQVALAHVQAKPEPPSRASEMKIPIALDAVVMACLEKDRARRPASAESLRDMLMAVPCGTPWTSANATQWWRSHLPHLAH